MRGKTDRPRRLCYCLQRTPVRRRAMITARVFRRPVGRRPIRRHPGSNPSFCNRTATFSGHPITIRNALKCRRWILRFSFYCQLVWQVVDLGGQAGPVCCFHLVAGKYSTPTHATMRVPEARYKGVPCQIASNAASARSMAMANPSPSNLCVIFLNVLTPITFPASVIRGPPLFPG